MGERDVDSLTRRERQPPADAARWSDRMPDAASGSSRSEDAPLAPRTWGQGSPWGGRGRAQRRPRSRAEASRRVPKMPKPQRETQVRTPGITVAGTLLIVALTVLAFAGGRLFGRVE